MYSNIKSVQILIDLMKQFEIRDVVLSPGGSDIPIIHSIETDSFFKCYSVVDERSAAYFAMGIAQQMSRPVACVCTSGTAVSNYMPGLTEAFYQNVPVLAITADKNPYYQDQLETQKINQEGIFSGIVRKWVSLPLIHSEDDEWLCNRLVNEAMLALNHHGSGPVQINIPIVGATNIYDCRELPRQRKMNLVLPCEDKAVWEKYSYQLATSKRLLVVVGQNLSFDEEDKRILNAFFERFHCVYAIEHLSNIRCNGTINTYPLTEMVGENNISDLAPDIVISIGNNLAAYNLKPFLRKRYRSIRNWLVSENGVVRDAYRCLTDIFECSPIFFFKKMLEYAPKGTSGTSYYDEWKKRETAVSLPELGFQNFLVGQELAKVIPPNSVLHCAILNSTRMMQFFNLPDNVRFYSNVGALGIDGCFSTFAGQAAATDELAFLLTGDLSFFYDMNAAGLRSISNNVRVIMMNNGGGSEFHFFMGKKNISTIDDYICAEHNKVAEGWIRSLGYKYYSARNATELKKALSDFGKRSEQPLFLEVFTKMEEDADKTRTLYYESRTEAETKSTAKGFAKGFVKSVLSQNQIEHVKKILKK